MLEWIATFLSLLGIFLNAKRLIGCWAIWLVSDVLWLLHSLPLHDYAACVLWVTFAGANIWGWKEWRKK